jgi:hypothetical protein
VVMVMMVVLGMRNITTMACGIGSEFVGPFVKLWRYGPSTILPFPPFSA